MHCENSGGRGLIHRQIEPRRAGFRLSGDQPLVCSSVLDARKSANIPRHGLRVGSGSRAEVS